MLRVESDGRRVLGVLRDVGGLGLEFSVQFLGILKSLFVEGAVFRVYGVGCRV